MLKEKWDNLKDEDTAEENIGKFDKAFLDKVTVAARKLIDESGKVEYNELAENLHMTRVTLNRKIKAITGQTTSDHILRIKLTIAKELLSDSDYPLAEIAFRCGIPEQSYFSTVFKKATGETPSSYRSKHLN